MSEYESECTVNSTHHSSAKRAHSAFVAIPPTTHTTHVQTMKNACDLVAL